MTRDTTADPGALPHAPVMVRECLEGLAVTPERWYVDGTFGAGGHSRAILAAGGFVLAIDQDPDAERHWEALAAEYPGQTRFAAGNFRALDVHAAAAGLTEVHGVLLDLGVSSMQLDEAERGFAFRQDGPLDMRMSAAGDSAADLVNTLPEEELAALIYRYGEERHSRRIARAIGNARQRAPITTTGGLAQVVASAYPPGRRRDHPARRTFQALRVAVNDELGALQDGLEAAARVLAAGGRLVVISYHSLEDRIVKHFIRESANLAAVTKRPLVATDQETHQNPRARSAKLRVAEMRPSEKGSLP